MPDLTLDIINRALQQMGSRSSVASLTENSNEARATSLIFNKAVVTVLTELHWNFAQSYAVGVAASASLIPRPWSYAYSLPPDLLSVRDVVGAYDTVPRVPILTGSAIYRQDYTKTSTYALGQSGGKRLIYTNFSPVNILYTALVTDFNLWESLALDALELYIASKLALPLSGDKTLMKGLWDEYQTVLLKARLRDANEDVSVQDVAPDWLLVRDDCGGFGGGSSGGGGGGGGATLPSNFLLTIDPTTEGGNNTRSREQSPSPTALGVTITVNGGREG